jgi:hypothetical protein
MIRPLIAALLAAAPALAQDDGAFSEGSNARSWSLVGEEKATFAAKVVDPRCELAGDCAPDCGGGARQLALLRTVDEALVPVLKNGQPLFNGAVDDLLPYCGTMVEVDGLLIGDDPANPYKTFQIQAIRPVGEADWRRANRWLDAWKARNPEVAGAEGPWFRNDPRVRALIERDGHLGLGLEVDRAFIEYLFP